ncbi:metal-dependent hydrolase [Brevibacillus migulae]|uniref:metal-dependent hydrolase n=1 Tax=Brevibacillus migulae TaxID=1644114 RepID=UPI00106EBBEA|nr:metal-dependent hydrolase [Brevibacillus migulae]
MDTGSHLLFGCTLAGLAYLDPMVSQHPGVAEAVMIGTVIGSHAPDFDTLVRIKGYRTYLRYHRGITHGIPALFIWPLVISLPLGAIYGLEGSAWWSVWLWSFIAVVFHVFLDMLNSYGVQCFRPFTKKWIHLDILSIFEPILFLLHVSAAILWIFFLVDPLVLFPLVYIATVMFIILRAWIHQKRVHQVKNSFREEGVCHVVPSFSWHTWRFVLETANCFYTGRIVRGCLLLEEQIPKEEEHEAIRATMGTDGVRAFLNFAQRIHVTCKEMQDGYVVSWSDVRFCYNRKLPFGVDVHLDKDLNVLSHHLGWRKKTWDPPFV